MKSKNSKFDSKLSIFTDFFLMEKNVIKFKNTGRLIQRPISTSSQGCIFLNIDMWFVANCRYGKRDFFHIGYMKIP